MRWILTYHVEGSTAVNRGQYFTEDHRHQLFKDILYYRLMGHYTLKIPAKDECAGIAHIHITNDSLSLIKPIFMTNFSFWRVYLAVTLWMSLVCPSELLLMFQAATPASLRGDNEPFAELWVQSSP